METKPGIYTTEFWATLATLLLGTLQLLTGTIDVNNRWVTVGMAVITGLYSVSRGLAKSNAEFTGQNAQGQPVSLVTGSPTDSTNIQTTKGTAAQK